MKAIKVLTGFYLSLVENNSGRCCFIDKSINKF